MGRKGEGARRKGDEEVAGSHIVVTRVLPTLACSSSVLESFFKGILISYCTEALAQLTWLWFSNGMLQMTPTSNCKLGGEEDPSFLENYMSRHVASISGLGNRHASLEEICKFYPCGRLWI